MGKSNEGLTLKERTERFSPGNSFGYTFYRASQIMSGYLVSFATYYATDSLMLSAAIVGVLFMISKCFDGVTDLIAGYILERSNTKYGKARPFILFGVLSWIGLILIFCTPESLSETGKYVWLFVMYTIDISVFQTLTNISDMPVLRRSSPNEKQRIKTLAIANVAVAIVAVVIAVLVPFVLAQFGKTQIVWVVMMSCFGAVGTILSIVAFLIVREYSDDELAELGIILKGEQGSEKVSVVEMLKSVGKNKYFIRYLLIYSVCSLVNAIASVSGTYYFSVNVGNIGLMSIASMTGILFYPLYAVYPKLIEKWGKVRFFQIAAALACVGYALRWFAGTNVVLVMAGSVMANFSAAMNFIYAFLCIDCMNYGQIITGKSTEGAYAAGQNFIYKVVAGIGSAMLGILLAMGHYDGALTTQPDSAYLMINFIFNGFPFLANVVAMLLVKSADPTNELKKLQAENQNIEER